MDKVSYRTFQIKVLFIVVMGLLLPFHSANSQSKSGKEITISGTVSKEFLRNMKGSLRIAVYTQMLIGADANLNQIYSLNLVKGKFKLLIRPTSDFIYIQPLFGPSQVAFKLILIKQGSDMTFNFSNSDTVSNVYNDLLICQLRLDRVFQKLPGISDTIALGRQRTTFLCGVDSILKDYKRIGRKASDLIRLDYMSRFNIRSLLRIRRVLGDDAASYSLRRQFIQYVTNQVEKDKSMKEEWSVRSSLYYVRSLYDLEQLYTKIAMPNDIRGSSFVHTYARIQRNYSGFLREKLLTQFFLMAGNSSPEAMKCLQSTITQISDSLYRKILISLRLSKTPGNPAYQFRLESNLGKFYTLEDFRNKVTIFKFWFSGCMSCISLEKILKPLKEKYKDNPNVAFVSVNVDMEKATWQRSVASAQYTSSPDIMLSTYDKGTNHPLLKFYHYFGFPQLLLIDKRGNIITPNPEKPVDSVSLLGFEKLIQEHL